MGIATKKYKAATRIKSKTSTFTLTKSAKKAWLEALRSGKYEQGNGQLLSPEGGYCCLGVLCSVLGATNEELLGVGMPFSISGGRAGWWLNERDYSVYVPEDSDLRHLSELNDSYCYTFEEIADLIEKYVPTHS